MKEVSGLEETDERMKGILGFYEMYLEGASVKEMKLRAQAMEAERLRDII